MVVYPIAARWVFETTPFNEITVSSDTDSSFQGSHHNTLDKITLQEWVHQDDRHHGNDHGGHRNGTHVNLFALGDITHAPVARQILLR